jgi:hypothetical protein
MKKCYIFLLICVWHDCRISLGESKKEVCLRFEVRPGLGKNSKPRQTLDPSQPRDHMSVQGQDQRQQDNNTTTLSLNYDRKKEKALGLRSNLTPFLTTLMEPFESLS